MRNPMIILLLVVLSLNTAFSGSRREADRAAASVHDFLAALMNEDVDTAMKFAQPRLEPDLKARMQAGISAMAGRRARILRILEVRTEAVGERNSVPTAIVFTRLELVWLHRNEAPAIHEYRWSLVQVEGRWCYDGGGF